MKNSPVTLDNNELTFSGERAERAAPAIAYRLTLPEHQSGVCCIAGQWQRNEQGEIEAWYTEPQLREVLDAMRAVKSLSRRTI